MEGAAVLVGVHSKGDIPAIANINVRVLSDGAAVGGSRIHGGVEGPEDFRGGNVVTETKDAISIRLIGDSPVVTRHEATLGVAQMVVSGPRGGEAFRSSKTERWLADPILSVGNTDFLQIVGAVFTGNSALAAVLFLHISAFGFVHTAA